MVDAPKDTEMKAEEVKQDEAKQDTDAKEEAKEEAKDVDMKEAEDEAKDEPGAEGKAAEEAKKEPEKPKEMEADAAEDSRPKVSAGAVDVSSSEKTLNAFPTADNKLLMALNDGGFQHLLAGVRCTAGVTGGRYMFETRIIESLGGKDAGDRSDKAPQPRNLLRIGLSLSGSSLLLGDGSAEGICFDSEGFLYFGRSRKKISAKFGRDSTVALLVNLDASSPNANTVSLFKDGQRASQPQPIPEALLGKALFPTVTYRSVTAVVNFGPQPLVPLPFACRTVGDAAAADLQIKAPTAPAGGKYDVLFPVGLPATGYFDWVDAFLERHPDYVELSDRKIVEWAVKSGMWRPKGPGHSNDKPDMKFGIPTMDDMSVSRLLKHVAPFAKCNIIVPELKGNLIEKERKVSLSRYSSPHFKKTACVFVGESTEEFKARVQELVLSDKKRKAQAEQKRKAAEEARAKAAVERKKKAEAKKAEAKKAGKEEAKEGEGEEPAAAEEKPSEEAKMEEEVTVELTDEEKALKCRKTYNPDVTEGALAKAFASFTLPSKEEGFDDVTFAWASEADAAKVLKDWIFAKKLTQRVEDLKVGDDFKEAHAAWQKQLSTWKKLAGEWKDPAKRKALLAKRAEAKKKAAEEKGDEAPKEDEKEPEVDMEELDVFGVENIDDLGNGMPLYADFAYEDWTLLSTRYEIHLLLHSFKKDLDDADRPSFAEKDLGFYFNKYFKRNFSVKYYGFEKLSELLELIKDTFSVNEKSGFLEAGLPADTAIAQFAKLTAENRRDRARRMDAGDETAEIKFPRGASAQAAQKSDSRGGKSGGWGSGGGKGEKKGGDKKGGGKGDRKGGDKREGGKGDRKGGDKREGGKGDRRGGGSSKGDSRGSSKGAGRSSGKGSSKGAGKPGDRASYRGASSAPPRHSGSISPGGSRGGYSSAPPKRSFASAGGSSHGASKYPRSSSHSGGGGGGGGFRGRR